MNERISFWSQMWSPVVMTETPARKRSIVIFPVIPRPPAAFSPLTMTKSNACFDFSSGSRAMTTERPGSPTTSPRKRTVSIFDHRIKTARNVDVKINDEIQSSNDEAITNDEARTVPFRHSGFVILSSLVIRAASFLVVFLSIFPATSHAGDNLGILGSKPKWSVLENYQETITQDEFSRLIQNVYCTHGFAPDLIEIHEKTVRLLMNRY